MVVKNRGKADHAITKVAVKSEVSRPCYQAVSLFHIFDLELGRTHGYAQYFSFIATHSVTTIIVSEWL